MNNKHSIKAIVLIFMLSVLFPLGAQTSDAASKYVELEIQWKDGRNSHIQTLRKDGVTYGSFYSLGSEARLGFGNGTDKMAVLEGYQKRIVVHMGSTIAEVDGRKVDMGREPVRYIGGHLYVPIRFLAEALGGKVINRDTKTGKVIVTGLNDYYYQDTFRESMMGHSYVIREAKGDLEITGVYSGHKTIIPLGIKNIDVHTPNLRMDLKWTPDNLLIINIETTNRTTDDYDRYTLIFKHQGLIRKSIAHGLTKPYEILKSDATIQLVDDKNIRLIEDGSGDVLEVIAR